MKLLVQNSGYHLQNLGDVAMLKAAVDLLRARLPEAEIQVYTSAPDRLAELIPDAVPVSPEGARLWSASAPFLRRWLQKPWRRVSSTIGFPWHLLRHLRPNLALSWLKNFGGLSDLEAEQLHEFFGQVEGADLVIATGGGYITSTFRLHGHTVIDTLALAQSLGKPTFLTGQGLGPFRPIHAGFRKLVKGVLRRAEGVGFRERRLSSELAKRFGLDPQRAVFTFDDAVTLVESERRVVEGGAIGLNLRIARYSGAGSDVIPALGSVLEGVRRKLDCRFEALPISSFAGDSDESTLRKLDEHAELFESRQVGVSGFPELFERLSRCSVVVTGSYHAGVFSAGLGIPVILITASGYYDQKMYGLADALQSDLSSVIDLREGGWEDRLGDLLAERFDRDPVAALPAVIRDYQGRINTLYDQIGLRASEAERTTAFAE